MDDSLIKAGKLARWLIEEKGVNKKTAYIIGSRKFKVGTWQDVRKVYNQKLKVKQIALL